MPNKRQRTSANFTIINKTEKIKNNCDSNITNEQITDFSCILNKKWKVFRASPMHNFNHNDLKRYEIKLSDGLHSIKNFNSKMIYHCKFSFSNKINLNNDFNEALKVEVIGNQAKNVYCAYFISCLKMQKINQEYISLPILLVESKCADMHVIIHSLLCKMFDFDIQPVMFPTYALITFFVNLLQSPRMSNDISKELLFLEDTTIVLAVIIDSLREKFKFLKSKEIVLEFYNRIMTHLYNLYHLELMRAELCKVVFPDAFIGIDGYLKLSTNEVALTVFKDLHSFICLEKLVNE